MRKRYNVVSFFLLFTILLNSLSGFSQIAAWDFFGESSPSVSTADIYNTNLDASNELTRGAGAAASTATNSFRTTGFQNNGISTANTDYFQFSVSASTGYTLSLSTIDARLAGTGTFAAAPGVSNQFSYSLNGVDYTLIGTPVITTGTPVTLPQVDLSSIAALQDLPASTTVIFRYYASGQTTTGGWGFTSPAAGQYGLAVGGTVASVSTTAPTKLVISSISPVSPTANTSFSVTVQAQDNTNVAQNVTANTNITLSVTTGTGTLSGTLTGTIPAGSNSVVITGVLYNTAENGVVITATRTAGDVLTSGNSNSFNVVAQASQLALVNTPTTGTATSILSSFTAEARRPDNSVDNTFTGNVTIAKASGPGTLSGTLTKAAVNGIATFSDLIFDQPGTYTITATSGSLTSATSGNIVIAAAPVQVTPGQVLINQFNPGYGGGATNEFIELVNTTGTAIDLSTLKIVYQTAAGNSGTAGGALSGMLLPNSFWLLSPNSTITIGQTLGITADGLINSGFGPTSAQLALARISDNVVIDGFAYGTITGGSLGEGTPASSPTSNSGYKRTLDGADNNANSTDFSPVAVSDIFLRNSSSRLANNGASIAAGNYTNLIVTGNSSLASNVSVSQLLDIKSGNLNTNNTLTLTSSAANTARVGIVTGTITGAVTVERFIPARRAWRLLNAPLVTSSTQTVNAAWQESGSNTPGFGTHITGGTTAAGFDQSPTNSSSIKIYDQASDVFNALPSTLSALKSQPGYFLFVRGDRTIDLSQGASVAATNTVLRATGPLKIGDTTISVNAAGFTLVGNPYASPIDFAAITKNNVPSRFYVWDPKRSSVGAYVLFDAADGYMPLTTGGSYSAANSLIQSGQAFFVQGSGLAGSLQIAEDDKSASNLNADVFRTNDGLDEKLQINLNYFNPDNTVTNADAAVTKYNNNYLNAVTSEDAGKPTNVDENLAILRDGHQLMVERRILIDQTDTMFLKVYNMKVKNYQLEITPTHFTNPSFAAYLEDSYLNSSTPVSLSSPTLINFSITADAASATPTRFKIVFKTVGVLPINFTNVKAYQKNSGIQVDWNMGTETNIKNYEVEKSANGQQFTKAAELSARSTGSYSWFDVSPITGNNFYRVKAVENTGNIKYSSIVNVKIGNIKSGFVVYPNPVKDRTLSLQLNNQQKGKYTVQLFNAAGQQVFLRIIEHIGGSATQTLQLGSAVKKGIYQLHISDGENRVNQQIICD